MKKWIICFLLAGISFCTYAQANNGEQSTKVTKVKTKTRITGDQNASMQSSSVNHGAMDMTNQSTGNSVAVHKHKTTHGTAMHKKTSSTHKKTVATAYKHHKINSRSGSAITMTHTSGHNAKAHTATTTSSTGTIETKTKIKQANGKVIKHKTSKSIGTTHQ